ncbi:hypothetical protein QUF80_22945 [Desulfococcaceae bacterium HSG8]|nr:hypothetical protein [Desulfococcaceae bacterium HSG8]
MFRCDRQIMTKRGISRISMGAAIAVPHLKWKKQKCMCPGRTIDRIETDPVSHRCTERRTPAERTGFIHQPEKFRAFGLL